jgi:hypothetical protein
MYASTKPTAADAANAFRAAFIMSLVSIKTARDARVGVCCTVCTASNATNNFDHKMCPSVELAWHANDEKAHHCMRTHSSQAFAKA